MMAGYAEKKIHSNYHNFKVLRKLIVLNIECSSKCCKLSLQNIYKTQQTHPLIYTFK